MEEKTSILISQLEANRRRSENVFFENIKDAEYKVFSQFGDDGIVEYLTGKLERGYETFVEFGVENYRESNTRLLLFRDNWQGLVLDSSEKNIQTIQSESWFWRYSLKAECRFVTCDNIEEIIMESGLSGKIGLLSIDVDGNDYWIWKSLQSLRPAIVVCEFNAIFSPSVAVTIPYKSNFSRLQAHYSGLYFGCSLGALVGLAAEKGYDFVGANTAGNNAYFLRSDLNPGIRSVTAEEGFRPARFREARAKDGTLTFSNPYDAAHGTIGDLEVIDLIENAPVQVRDVIYKGY